MRKLLIAVILFPFLAGCGHPVTVGLLALLAQPKKKDKPVAVPLQITTASLQFAINGTAYSDTVTAAGGSQPYAWSITANSPPAGITIDAVTGELSGTPGDLAGDFTFTVQVVDSATDSATRDLTITLYDDLQITYTPPLPDATLATPYGPVTITTTGGTGNYTWSITAGSLPSGLTLNTSNGEISGTPNDTVAAYPFTVMVQDDALPAQSDTIDLTINLWDALTITTASLPYAVNSVAYNATVSAGGGTLPYTWSISAGSPPTGVTIDSGTGVLSGTPADTATDYVFTVQVVDGGATSATKQFTLTLYDELQITYTPPLPDAENGQAYGPETITVTGGTGNTTWSLSAGILPSGVTLTTTNGDISGTPSDTVAAYPITVMVQDDAVPAQTDTLDLTLNLFNTLTITTTTLPYAINGVAYNEPLSATGGTGTNTWSESGGPNLPSGLSVGAGGTIQGTAADTTGLYNFTVQVDDDGTPAQSDTQALSIDLYDQLQITTGSPLPDALLGAAYNETLMAAGGTGNYTWSEVTSELATYGLAMDAAGVISGTPSQTGTCAFTVEVQDDESPAQVVQKDFTISVYDFNVDFTATPTTGAAPLIVDFTNLSVGSIVSWEWNFGDGSPLDTTNWDTSHTYNAAGWYTVTLVVNTATQTATRTRTDYILVSNNIWYVDDGVGASGVGTSWPTAFKTIQEGLNAAGNYDLILVADGTYQGAGNVDLDFGVGGVAAYLKADDHYGTATWVIDIQNTNNTRGFYFHNGEGNDSVVDGFTIQNGRDQYGGGICCDGASPTIRNCTITNNTSARNGQADYGGGIYLLDSSPVLNSCVITNNTTGGHTTNDRGGGIYCTGASNPVIAGCTISDNTAAARGGGIYCNNNSPTIINCIIANNTAGPRGGGIYCTGGGADPQIYYCTISGNTASGVGGGVCCRNSSDALLVNCTLTDNTAVVSGGGFYCANANTTPTLVGCVISNNDGGSGNNGIGGGICCEDEADVTLGNCTIANNVSDYGGGVYCRNNNSLVTLANCIVWGNTATTGNQLRVFDNALVNLSYSDYADGANDVETGGGGVANPDADCITDNPLYVTAGSAGVGGGGDFHLQDISPCIDDGNNAYVPGGVTTDLDGNPRIANVTVDMGAYEYQP